MNLNDRQAGYVFDRERPNVIINHQSIMCIRLLLIFDYDFLSNCSSLIKGISIHYLQHCEAMLEHGVYELAYNFFQLLTRIYGS